MTARRQHRLPLIRVGLLLVAGSVLASLVRFYVDMGDRLAGSAPGPVPADRAEVMEQFLADFLLAGTLPGMLFWAGLGVTLLGALLALYRAATSAR